MKNKKIPIGIIIGVIAVAYFFLPIDAIPDLVVGLGQVDDIAVVGVALVMEVINAKWGLGYKHDDIKEAAESTVGAVKGDPGSVGTKKDKEDNVIDGDYTEI